MFIIISSSILAIIGLVLTILSAMYFNPLHILYYVAFYFGVALFCVNMTVIFYSILDRREREITENDALI